MATDGMSTYSPLMRPTPGEEATGSLPELEEADAVPLELLQNRPDGSPRSLAAVSRALLVARKAGPLLVAAVLVSALLAFGLISQASSRAVSEHQQRGAVTGRSVEVLQEAPVRTPCDPLVDEKGTLLALNPCEAPMDTMGGPPGSMGQINQELGQDVAKLLSDLKVDEKVEASPWTVVAPGWVDVVKEKGGAFASASEPHCSIVMGVREGAWLKLSDNRGYMLILDGSNVFLEAGVFGKTTYTLITNGTCADNFLFPVLEDSECEAAAKSLELFDTSAEVDTAGTPIPPGCYVTATGKLRFQGSEEDQSYGQIAGSWRKYLRQPTSAKQVFEVICSSQDTTMQTCDPFHNTTTSTTTPEPVSTSPLNITRQPGWQPSLYCFCVTRAVGYEPGLALTQYAKGASIFGCDEYKVFSNGGIVSFGAFDSTEIKAPDAAYGVLGKTGVTTNSFLNTMIFMQTWDAVIAEGRFWYHDWVVKVDPDAVFFPERLRLRLVQYTPANFNDGPSTYFKNCDLNFGPWDQLTDGKIFGSLEIYSRNAIKAYAYGGEEKCKAMQWHGWGEDFYMQKCMILLGMNGNADYTLVGDKRCHFAPCTDASRVAFHDFKDIGQYFDCWGKSLGPGGVAAYEEKAKKKMQAKK